ncbi:TPA: hypothetical protein ACF2C8_001888 [Clostridium perfringens]
MSYIGIANSNIELIKSFLKNSNVDAIDAFLTIRSGNIVIIFPLLATIIFSDSYLVEKENGFTKFVYTKLSIKKYVFIKVIVNIIVSALIGGLASFLILIFLVFIFGIKNPSIASYTNSINGPFNYLLASSNTRLIYGLIVVILFSISYIVMSTLALGISAWIKNRYLVLIAPFFYYILCGTIIERLGINRIFDFHLARVISLKHSMTKPMHLFIYLFLLLLVGIALFYVGVVIKNEKDL